MPGVKGRSGGRNAKPTQAHVLTGTFRADRHGDHETPEAPKGRPEPPKPLEGDALDEWNRMIGHLETLGTLTVVDGRALYQYVQLFAETERHAATKEVVASSAQTLEENIGDFKGPELVACFQEISKMRRLEASYATQIRQGRMAIRQYLVEFGLTPAARPRVKLPPKKAESKVDQFRQAKGTA